MFLHIDLCCFLTLVRETSYGSAEWLMHRLIVQSTKKTRLEVFRLKKNIYIKYPIPKIQRTSWEQGLERKQEPWNQEIRSSVDKYWPLAMKWYCTHELSGAVVTCIRPT